MSVDIDLIVWLFALSSSRSFSVISYCWGILELCNILACLVTIFSIFSKYFDILSTPLSLQGPPLEKSKLNIKYILNTSAPYLSIYSSGETVFPLLLLILFPSGPKINPWCTNFLNGSSKFKYPISLSAFVINLE